MKKLANNKKGFSLIELIIVIAIMVALIAVMAPNFVKYVQKSRDTALSTAAEDFFSAVKVAYGDPDSEYTLPTTDAGYEITVKVDWSTKKLTIEDTTGKKLPGGELDNLVKAAGADTDKVMGTTSFLYTITIKKGPEFKMVENTAGNPKTAG